MDLQITPKKLSGAVTPPSSKSQAHRLLIAAASAAGSASSTAWRTPRTSGHPPVPVCHVCRDGGSAGWHPPGPRTGKRHRHRTSLALLDCGESGSTLRFLIPVGLLIQERRPSPAEAG